MSFTLDNVYPGIESPLLGIINAYHNGVTPLDCHVDDVVNALTKLAIVDGEAIGKWVGALGMSTKPDRITALTAIVIWQHDTIKQLVAESDPTIVEDPTERIAQLAQALQGLEDKIKALQEDTHG